jgi:hypothetical protein
VKKSRWKCAAARQAVVVCAVLISAGASSSALGQVSFHTVLTNGPVSNRFNIVFLSEGYTNNELPRFLVDATNALNGLFSHQPYQEYRSYFNAFAISVPSNQSGSDHPVSNLYRDTYFNSSYDPISDYLVTIPTNSTGQGKVDALIQSNMPNTHLAVLLVNDVVPGGSDGFDKTAISSTGASYAEILTHESGHVVANLGDEYTNANPGFPDTEEPNTTRQTNRALIKWQAWISTNTPVPTPPVDAYSSSVGLFEGAHYHPTNWYRPQLNCLMRSLYSPFCAVCSESMVLSFYRRLKPIDSFTPASTNLSISTTQSLSFNLVLLQPSTHSLNIQWFMNGNPIAQATNSSLTLPSVSLQAGSNWINAVVKDQTTLVRSDPTGLLMQSQGWSVINNMTSLHLDSAAVLAGGQFVLRVTGNAPGGFSLQTSTNLLNWKPVLTNSLSGGQFWFTNNGAGAGRSFYRALTPPG